MPIAHELKQWMWLPMFSLALWAGLYQQSLLPAPQPLMSYVEPDRHCGSVDEVRTLFTSEWDVPHPAGVAYSLQLDQLALVNSTDPEQDPDGETMVSVITPYEDLVGMAQIEFTVDDTTNIAYDEGAAEPEGPRQLLLLNGDEEELARISVGEDGLPDNDTLTVSDIDHLNLDSAAGIGVDSAGRRLFILDSAELRVVSVDLDNELALLNQIDLSLLEVSDLRGLAFHPHNGHLFTVSAEMQTLYELSEGGELVNSYDLASLNLVDPRGLAFGPSADLTDAPDILHLFLADSYWDHSEGLLGHVLELALKPDCIDVTGVELSSITPAHSTSGASALRASASRATAAQTSCTSHFN